MANAAKKADTNTSAVNKKAEAIKIYRSMQRRKNAPKPADVKARLAEKLGMSKAMAATYYYNIHSGKWGGNSGAKSQKS